MVDLSSRKASFIAVGSKCGGRRVVWPSYFAKSRSPRSRPVNERARATFACREAGSSYVIYGVISVTGRPRVSRRRVREILARGQARLIASGARAFPISVRECVDPGPKYTKQRRWYLGGPPRSRRIDILKRIIPSHLRDADGRQWTGKMVPRRGLEPPRPCDRQHLKLVRLPIPPSGHGVGGGLYGGCRGLSTGQSPGGTINSGSA